MSVNVKNGTPLSGPALCETCSYGMIRTGYRLGDRVVLCRWTEPTTRVEFRVRECKGYNDKTRPSMYEMERIACSISPQRGKETAGFAPSAAKSVDAETVELVLDNQD